MRRTLIILLLLVGPVVYGDDAGPFALLVRESDVDVPRVRAALAAEDPLLRATAARLANVREVRALVPALRKVLADAHCRRDSARPRLETAGLPR